MERWSGGQAVRWLVGTRLSLPRHRVSSGCHSEALFAEEPVAFEMLRKYTQHDRSNKEQKITADYADEKRLTQMS